MLTDTKICKFDYDIEHPFISEDMSNKLFCTFTTESTLSVLFLVLILKPSFTDIPQIKSVTSSLEGGVISNV